MMSVFHIIVQVNELSPICLSTRVSWFPHAHKRESWLEHTKKWEPGIATNPYKSSKETSLTRTPTTLRSFPSLPKIRRFPQRLPWVNPPTFRMHPVDGCSPADLRTGATSAFMWGFAATVSFEPMKNLKKEHHFFSMRGGWPAKQVWMYQVGGDIQWYPNVHFQVGQVCQSRLATNMARFFLVELAYYCLGCWNSSLWPHLEPLLINHDVNSRGLRLVESSPNVTELVSSVKIPLENRW